jgi:hypothetical protein
MVFYFKIRGKNNKPNGFIKILMRRIIISNKEDSFDTEKAADYMDYQRLSIPANCEICG